MAADRGLELVRERDTHNRKTMLYRVGTRSGPLFYITSGHIITTLTAVERVAQWAFLHS